MKENRILDEQERELIRKAFLFDTEEELPGFINENMNKDLLRNGGLKELADMGEGFRLIEVELEKSGKTEIRSLIRLMRETGIRLMDAVELTESDLNGREVICVERKRGNTYYQYPDGSFPVVSSTTKCLLKANEDGRFFTHKPQYYMHFLHSMKKLQNGKLFRYHDLRNYWRTRNKVLRRAGIESRMLIQ